MLYLLLAIVGSGVIPVIFRAFDKLGVNLFWAIPANYVICVLIGNIWARSSLELANLVAQPWIGLAAIQGILLLTHRGGAKDKGIETKTFNTLRLCGKIVFELGPAPCQGFSNRLAIALLAFYASDKTAA